MALIVEGTCTIPKKAQKSLLELTWLCLEIFNHFLTKRQLYRYVIQSAQKIWPKILYNNLLLKLKNMHGKSHFSTLPSLCSMISTERGFPYCLNEGEGGSNNQSR